MVYRNSSTFRFRLNLVHVESFEKPITNHLNQMVQSEVKEWKNLKYLYADIDSKFDSTFLSGLEQLEEIHLTDCDEVFEAFRQARWYGRANLIIYLSGLLLSGSADPAMLSRFDKFNPDTDRYLTENQSRLADEMPLRSYFLYKEIEVVAPKLEIPVLERFMDLVVIIVNRLRTFSAF